MSKADEAPEVDGTSRGQDRGPPSSDLVRRHHSDFTPPDGPSAAGMGLLERTIRGHALFSGTSRR